MKLDPDSYFLHKIIPLKDSVYEFLKEPEENVDHSKQVFPINYSIKGGILSDIRFSWLARGSKLEVIHTKIGSKMAAWCFGSHDFNTSIVNVVDIPVSQGKLPLLIVGLECEITGGMICLFDISSSRVVRSIQIEDKITSLHVVNAGSDFSLPGPLRTLDGVLAVGTSTGKVLLIDLCRQICEEAILNNGTEKVRDEMNSCHLIKLSLFDLNHVETHKETSLKTDDHICIQLNEPSTSGVHFALHGPNGEVRLHVNKVEVAISALHYCPQLGSLLVGYNFGAFQIYNLLNMQLVYTSPVYEDCIPISHFAFQEPCDDPRAFCYMWVIYNTIEKGDDGFPMAVMYSFTYDRKDYLDDYGFLYQEFQTCSVRFQFELTSVPGFPLSKPGSCAGARCVSVNSYTKAVINRQCASPLDIPEEKLALCSLAWTAWNQNLTNTETYLCLFDLNQWYKERMPFSTQLKDDANSYMTCVSLTELYEIAVDENFNDLLDLIIDHNSFSPFVCAQRLEEHYFPASLAFGGMILRENNCVWFGNAGIQKYLLMQLENCGPLCLTRPTELFQRCLQLGLIPMYSDNVEYGMSTPLKVQREMILSIALEHQLVHWLCRCARDWANGSQSAAGCTLDMLLDWAWQRANTLKFQSDKICIPLFDHSGIRLDANALIQLNHCACQLKILTVLFDMVANFCKKFLTEQDVSDIRYQLQILQMISTYLEVLQWLLNVGLLPECPLSMYPLPDERDRISAPYPAENLNRFYQSRRAELQELKTLNNDKHSIYDGNEMDNYCDLLFIDNLIEIECSGSILRKQWESDGGNGLYPPPSLQALLRTYLVEDIDIVHKHCLFIYLFLDLAKTFVETRYKSIITHLIKFPAVFKIDPSIIKITQAFWQLDHGDFSTAMSQLLDTSVSNENLKPWHHRIILKALLIQGQHQHALLYQQVRKPPVSNLMDIYIIITLLIVNDLLQEAFHFQRQHRSIDNEKELLKHFFCICDKKQLLESVLQLPLSSNEEKELLNYLETIPTENSANVLFTYYLQRARYKEAFELNGNLNKDVLFKQGLIGQMYKDARNTVLEGLNETLPVITQSLLKYCKKEKQKTNPIIRVAQPVPMSVVIHDSKDKVQYKSTLIQTSFQKAKETWTPLKFLNKSALEDADTPFISTPKRFTNTQTRRSDSSIIYPIIMNENNEEALDEDVTPAKRLKLSSRASINERLNSSQKRLSCYNSPSLLSTPIVKRRSYRSDLHNQELLESFNIGTPPSILKVRSYCQRPSRYHESTTESVRGSSTTPEILDDEKMSESPTTPLINKSELMREINSITLNKTDINKRHSLLSGSFMNSVQKPSRPSVRFEEEFRSNSGSSNESGENMDVQQMEVRIDVHRESTPDVQVESSNLLNSKSSSGSTDDVFYSPDNSSSFTDARTSSTNEQNNSKETAMNISEEKIENTNKTKQSISLDNPESKISPLKRKANDNTSIRSRISYKLLEPNKNILNNSTNSPPIRKSLRLQKINSENSPLVITESPAKPEKQKVEIVPKVKARRSLSRQVLENNMITNTLFRSNTDADKKSLSTHSGKNVDTTILVTESSTSTVKIISDDKIEETSTIKKLEKKDEFCTENRNTLSEIIKHVHNESQTKSVVKKVTEMLDENKTSNVEECKLTETFSDFKEPHFLSFSSDISENDVAEFYENCTSVPEDIFAENIDEQKGILTPVIDLLQSDDESEKDSSQSEEESENAMEEDSNKSEEESENAMEEDLNQSEEESENAMEVEEIPVEQNHAYEVEYKKKQQESSEEECDSNQDEDERESNQAVKELEIDGDQLSSQEVEEERISNQDEKEAEVEGERVSIQDEEERKSIQDEAEVDEERMSIQHEETKVDKEWVLSNFEEAEVEEVEIEERVSIQDEEEETEKELVSSQDEEQVSSQDEERVSSQDVERVSSQDEERVSSQDEERVSSQDEERLSNQDEERVSSQNEEQVSSQDEESEDEQKQDEQIENQENYKFVKQNVEYFNKENKPSIYEDIDPSNIIEIKSSSDENSQESSEKEQLSEDDFDENVEEVSSEASLVENNEKNLSLDSTEKDNSDEENTNEESSNDSKEDENIVDNNNSADDANEEQNSYSSDEEINATPNEFEMNIEQMETIPEELEISVINYNQEDANNEDLRIQSNEENVQMEYLDVIEEGIEEYQIEMDPAYYITDNIELESIEDASANILERNIEEMETVQMDLESVSQSAIKEVKQELLETKTSPEPIISNTTSTKEEEILETPTDTLETKMLPEPIISNTTTTKEKEILETSTIPSEPETKVISTESTKFRSENIDTEKNSSDKFSKIQRRITRKRSGSVDVQNKETFSLDKPSKPTTRSLTRQRSTSIDIEENSKIKGKTIKTRLRSASVDVENKDETIFSLDEPTKPLRRTKQRSVSVTLDNKPKEKSIHKLRSSESTKQLTTSENLNDRPSTSKDFPSRTRRATSIDSDKSVQSQKNKRGVSVEAENVSPSTKRSKTQNIASLESNVILKETESVSEKIDEYAVTHRMTRRQKMIMAQNFEKSSLLPSNPTIETISESPDKEDNNSRNISPVSSICSSITTRSASKANASQQSLSNPRSRKSSSTSITPPLPPSNIYTESDTPSRPPRRRSFTQAQQAIITPKRKSSGSRSSMEQDDSRSEISSVMSVPLAASETNEKMQLRHRSLSPNVFIKEKTSTPRRRMSTRSSVLPLKTELSKISEEQNTSSAQVEETEVEEKQERTNTMTKDAENQEISESQSSIDTTKSRRSKSGRRTVYKPSENYLTKTVIKPRKSFKLKKSDSNA